MLFSAYIYRGLFGDNLTDQIETIRSIEIEEKIDSFSTLSFVIDYFVDDE